MSQLFQNKSLDIYIPSLKRDIGYSVKLGFSALCLCQSSVILPKDETLGTMFRLMGVF